MTVFAVYALTYDILDPVEDQDGWKPSKVVMRELFETEEKARAYIRQKEEQDELIYDALPRVTRFNKYSIRETEVH